MILVIIHKIKRHPPSNVTYYLRVSENKMGNTSFVPAKIETNGTFVPYCTRPNNT